MVHIRKALTWILSTVIEGHGGGEEGKGKEGVEYNTYAFRERRILIY